MARRLTIYLGVLLCSGLAAGAQTAQPPVAAFATLPTISSAELSPDGNHLLMLRAIGETYHAVHLDLQTGKSNMVLASDPTDFLFNWCQWANNERIVCSIRRYGTLRAAQIGAGIRRYSDGRTTFTRLLAANADGSQDLQLIRPANNRLGRDLQWNAVNQDNIISWLPDDPEHVLIALPREDRIRPAVFRLNIYSNKMSRVRRHHDSVYTWYANRAGEIRFATGFRNSRPVAFSLDGGRFREVDISHLLSRSIPAFYGINAQGDRAYIAGHIDNYRGIYEIDTATGEVTRKLFADDGFDVYGTLFRHPQTWQPLLVQYWREELTRYWFDDALAKKGAEIQAALAKLHSSVAFVSSDDALNRFVLRAEGNGTPPTYYLYTDDTKSLQRLATTYPDISSVLETRTISYQAADGRSITGYVTTPIGEGPFPAVLFPHGGPWLRDTPEFDYWVQFFVSRDYAVLKMNFRGSIGYGAEHLAAGFEQWGLAMQDDVIDGLDWMIEQNIADPERVCIVGGSYGGYAALVAAYKTPERLRCAVAFAGVSDLADLKRRAGLFDLGELTQARIQEGTSVNANSPYHQIDKIGVPLLIVHGDLDRSVMIEQSRKLVSALERAGKPHIYIEQTDGDHFLSLQRHRQEFFTAMDEFLAQHLN